MYCGGKSGVRHIEQCMAIEADASLQSHPAVEVSD